jgi:hypothetical protein
MNTDSLDSYGSSPNPLFNNGGLINRKKKVTAASKVKTVLKSIDIYAKPIQLTYQGKEKFRTSCGGFLSLCVILFIVSLFAYNTRDLINRSKTSIKKNSIVSQTNSYSPPENLSARNITVAFKLSDFWASQTINDPSYGTLILRQLIVEIKKNETDGTSYRTFEFKNIPYSSCELGKNIHYSNVDEINQFNIGTYFCADWNNLTI